MQDTENNNPEVRFQKRFSEIFEIYKQSSLRSADQSLEDSRVKFTEMSEVEKSNDILNNFWMYLPGGGYREMFDMCREYYDEGEQDSDSLIASYKILDRVKELVDDSVLNEQVAGIVEYKRSIEKSDGYDKKLANRVMLEILFKMIDEGWDLMKLRA